MPEAPNVKATEYFKDFPEAPASVIVFVKTKTGKEVQLTLRDWDELTLMKRVERLYQSYEPGDKEPGLPRKDAQLPDNCIVIQDLVISLDKGKVYAKVIGEPFTEYGVRVWPEAFVEAGLGAWVEGPQEDLLFTREMAFDPPDLKGWRAFYETKGVDSRNRPKPHKVIRLERP